MLKPATPPNEAARLRKLRDYAVLDTAPESGFDAVTRLAAHIAGTPIALVSLVDTDRQWFKSRYGLDAPETPRDVSFCGHVVAAEAPLIVRDSFADERFSDNPLVRGEPHVRFYAGVPLRTPDGFVLGSLCTIDHEARDFSREQREMLELLARQVIDLLEVRRKNVVLQSEFARLEHPLAFFELSPDLMCTADATLHMKELNPAWEDILGWTPDELRQQPFTAFIHPDDLQAALAEASRLAEGGRTVHFGSRCRHKAGHWVSLSWTAVMHRGIFYASARDESQRLRDQERLDESERRARSILDAAIDGFITIDEMGVVLSVNPAVERLFGYPPSEVVGRNVSMLMPSPDREQHDGYLQRYRQTGARRVIGQGREVTALRKDGTTFAAELAVSELVVGGKRLFTGTLRDISERKRVARLQSEFISTVSHELRTPLTSIRGALGLVAAGVTGELPNEAREYVDIAVTNSDRLVRLINDILDIEKMQSGAMDFHLRAIDLGEAIKSSLAANDAFVSGHRARLVLSGPVPPGEVLVDPDRLSQVLTNLISNAAKFSPPETAVEVSVQRLDDRFRVDVRDHGPGIPEEFHDRIFERFAQADASTTRQKGGTGLGLAISKAIVEKMRGRIAFEPAPGGGTRFFFELPYLPPVLADGASLQGASRVLVCEDDPDVSRLLSDLLSTAGFAVHVAPTLERARRLLEINRYDAITLDLSLADGDGSMLIAELRASDATRLTPVIVVSGSNRDLGAAAIAVTDIITKPFDNQRVVTALQNAIATCRSTNPSVLHVEDDPDILRIIGRTMPASWTVRTASTVQAAKAALAEGPFDVVLLDLSLPDGDGSELIGLVGTAQVIIFSARDAPTELSRRVSSALVKSRVTPMDVRDAIIALSTLPRKSRA